jgi:glycosyltransferase involved in cell wall biosynthesis
VKVTVAICTWNRCEMLRATLQSLTRCTTPPGLSWEVLVVNNNCTDKTDDVAASFSDRLPLRRVFEAAPGLSHARNAAVRAAGGDYVIWTDDDVLVSEAWLSAYLAAFDRRPDAAVFGGPIRPYFEAAPPDWLAHGVAQVAEAYGMRVTPAQEAEIRIESNQFPFGANFSIRTRELKEHPFDTSVGRAPGNSYLGGEEIGVIKAVLASGRSGWWLPDAILDHRIRVEQMTMDYVQKYYVGVGRWMGLSDAKQPCRRLLGYPAWMVREYAITRTRDLFLRPRRGVVDELGRMKSRWILTGRLLASRTRPG